MEQWSEPFGMGSDPTLLILHSDFWRLFGGEFSDSPMFYGIKAGDGDD